MLRLALHRAQSGEEADRHLCYALLLDAELLLVLTAELAPAPPGAPQPVSLLVTPAATGEPLLCAFTHDDEARRLSAEPQTLTLAGPAVLELTLSTGLAGLVVNPSGDHLVIPAADLQTILAAV